jgi:hypothetical protein
MRTSTLRNGTHIPQDKKFEYRLNSKSVPFKGEIGAGAARLVLAPIGWTLKASETGAEI